MGFGVIATGFHVQELLQSFGLQEKSADSLIPS